MNQYFGPVSLWDVFYAAVAAFVLTMLIQRFRAIRGAMKKEDELSMDYKGVDLVAVIKKCRDMFPIDTVCFKGKIFRTGMIVRVTTLQEKVIEGQLIGKNNLDFLCILTSRHIIAHELDKIEDIVLLEQKN